MCNVLSSFFGSLPSLVQPIVTIVGVFLAAQLAYRNERKKAEAADRREREKAEQNEFKARAAAVNLAVLSLSQMYSTLRQYKRDIIDPSRADPHRWCTMRPSDLTSGQVPEFNLPALQFLFGSEDPNVVARLAIQSRAFAYSRDLAARRTAMHMNELQPAIERSAVPPPHTIAHIETAVGPRIKHTMTEYTDGLIKDVDLELVEIKKLQDDLRKVALPMVGDQRIILFLPDVTTPAAAASPPAAHAAPPPPAGGSGGTEPASPAS